MAVMDGDAAGARAMELQLQGQLEAAREAYAEILRTEPQHAVANYGLGMIQIQYQRPGEALPLLHAALQSAPDVADYWLGYLEALLLAGRLAGARQILQLGLQRALRPDDAATREFVARLQAAEQGAQREAEVMEERLQTLVVQGASHEAMQLAVQLIGNFRRAAARGSRWVRWPGAMDVAAMRTRCWPRR